MDGRVSFSPLAAILKKLKQGMRRESSRERDDLVGWGYHKNNSYHMYIVFMVRLVRVFLWSYTT